MRLEGLGEICMCGRFVPSAGAKSEAAVKQDASRHTYLPEAGAKPEVPLRSSTPWHA